MIINYEVQFEEDPEEIVLAGGLKGIRALRKQRDVIDQSIADQISHKFSLYDQRKPEQEEELKR